MVHYYIMYGWSLVPAKWNGLWISLSKLLEPGNCARE